MDCGECGGKFVWDADAQSAVCLDCGLLQDASQVVLDSQLEAEDSNNNGKTHDRLANTLHPRTTLKALRSKSGWDLPGQGKDAARLRQKNAMAQYILGLAKRMGHPGLYPRTQLLFDQALEKGHVRWGRKARLVAGAAFAIALREGRKGETMKDIAFLLEESPVAVARAFTRLVELLQIKLSSTDPSWYLSSLRNRLVDLLKEPKPALPHNLVKLLKQLHLPSLLHLAMSLSEHVSRAGTVANLPSQPSACAIFILAIEGELMSSVPHCETLAKTFALRYGISGDVIMRRYKVIADEVLNWSQEVPWLRNEADELTSKKPKVARRTVVARSLKDVVQYKEGLWKAAFEASGPLGAVDEDEDVDSGGSVSTGSEVALHDNGIDTQQQNAQDSFPTTTRPKKRRRVHQMDGLSEFLLSPLRAQSQSHHQSPAQSPYASAKATNIPSLDAISHILAADSPSFDQPASRLQVLSLSKSADDITDEELFDENELESLIRTQDEREVLARALGWTEENASSGDGNKSNSSVVVEAHRPESSAMNAESGDAYRHGTTTSRINMEALNRLLDDAEVIGEVDEEVQAADDGKEMDEVDWISDFAGVDDVLHPSLLVPRYYLPSEDL